MSQGTYLVVNSDVTAEAGVFGISARSTGGSGYLALSVSVPERCYLAVNSDVTARAGIFGITHGST